MTFKLNTITGKTEYTCDGRWYHSDGLCCFTSDSRKDFIQVIVPAHSWKGFERPETYYFCSPIHMLMWLSVEIENWLKFSVHEIADQIRRM